MLPIENEWLASCISCALRLLSLHKQSHQDRNRHLQRRRCRSVIRNRTGRTHDSLSTRQIAGQGRAIDLALLAIVVLLEVALADGNDIGTTATVGDPSAAKNGRHLGTVGRIRDVVVVTVVAGALFPILEASTDCHSIE